MTGGNMANENDSSRVQASEAHETTADASASPTSASDERTTRERSGQGNFPGSEQKLNRDMGAAQIVSDQGDDGGPVVIRDDQRLAPPAKSNQ
jgi:hypothetical protein